VSIEVAEPKKEVKPVGSGFLVVTAEKHLALVTAKHVVFDKENEWKLRPHLAYRLNRKEDTSDLFTEALVAKHLSSGWFKSEKYDVACRMMVRRTKGSDILKIPYSLFLTDHLVQPGAPLLIIGFPMGMRSKEYAMPILRRGIVARTDHNKIIADAFVFPGNSGGPVVYAPLTPLGKGFRTPILQDQQLAGLVSNSISCREVAISSQTKRPRIIFEDNSGLCNIVPASAILELLESPEFKAADTKQSTE